jgi:hypothetical protein
MANHKKRRPINRRAGCKMCKRWKINGMRTERIEAERYSDHVRRTVADRAVKEAMTDRISATNYRQPATDY